MAAICDVCGKGPGFGHSISHSHRRTKRRWNPNIQTGARDRRRHPEAANVCTSCIKAGKVTRAIPPPRHSCARSELRPAPVVGL